MPCTVHHHGTSRPSNEQALTIIIANFADQSFRHDIIAVSDEDFTFS